MQALVTLPGLESFLIGECKRCGIRVEGVEDGWALTGDDARGAVGRIGTLRALAEVVWSGPAERLPSRLPDAERLWFEGQVINGGARCEVVRQAVLRASGVPRSVQPDGLPGTLAIVNRQGVALVGEALAWGLERRRSYRVALMARSLNPAMARAMAMASRARPGDVFLDPFCGSGTVLAERALLGACRLIGRDADTGAVDAARRTLAALTPSGPHDPGSQASVTAPGADIRGGDARALDLPDGAVSAVAMNLPFGHRFGRATDNADLYPRALREAARVLCPRGRLVVLTGDRRHLRQALRACGPLWRVRSEARVYLGGLEPTLGVYDRTEAAPPPRQEPEGSPAG